jgi:exosome complex component CSL4
MSESTTHTIPGEQIAFIEEFEAGQNTFDDGDKVRATVVGIKNINKKDRTASVTNTKVLSVPKVGDIITGNVAAVMSSMIVISVDYINGIPIKAPVECVCSIREIRKKNTALVNDIVTAKILNHLNGAIHATINEPDLGVLFTKCRKCGDEVILFRDAIKCKECGWIDERKLASNFGDKSFIKQE